uniref:Acetylcholinesterase n=1 Tax=Parastrongyloides trichosuri TaxID=131310 RepID=A0A0N4ZI25_PARTI
MFNLGFINGLFSFYYAAKLTEVNMPCGRYIGNTLRFEGNGKGIVTEFVGIPYAYPPINELRFQNPKPYCKRGKPIYCNEFKPVCPQILTSPTSKVASVRRRKSSEDCLYLNVWIPTVNDGEADLPVLVVFHDGNFLEGSANTDIFNASYFSYKTQSVVVTVNYRLNVFGFAQSWKAYYIPGNMGLKDQQVALKWIYENIEFFNGDKHKITILGIGSGAASVSAHLMVKESFKYYKAAVLISGHMASVKYSKPYKTVQEYTEKLMKRVGCSGRYPEQDLMCLRKKSTYKIIKEAGKLYKEMTYYEYGSPFSISLSDNTFFKRKINDKFIGRPHDLSNFNSNAKILLVHTGTEGLLDLLSGLYSSVFVFNRTKWKYDIKVDVKTYSYILSDVVKKFNLRLYDKQSLDEAYSSHTMLKDRVIRLLSDAFIDCDLKMFTSRLGSDFSKYPYVLLMNKTSSNKIRERFPEIGSTSEDIVEYLFGNPFRNRFQYPASKWEEEKNFSLKMMKMFGTFFKNYTFNEEWNVSDSNIFRERMSMNGEGAVTEFLGIPYAQPPVGNLRFSNPQRPACNKDYMYVCDEYSKACPQIDNFRFNSFDSINVNEKIKTSEDCLYLNVWASNGYKLPVIVVFHSGNFLRESGNLNMYNGSYLAAKTKAVVVTFNYRLNVFGFAQSYGGYYIPGNMGLKDQQMALRWVHENIDSFNGDKHKVTILGIESGAASVSAHLIVKESFKYYNAAVLISGHMASVNDVVKKFNLRLYDKQSLDEAYSSHTMLKDRIVRLLSDAFNDCDLKMFTSKLGSHFSKYPHVLLMNKTSSNIFRESFPGIGTTSEEIVEYLFGNPFRNRVHYRAAKWKMEKAFSLKVMEFFGSFIKNFTPFKKYG